MMAASAVGQTVFPTAVSRHTTSGQVVTARIAYYSPPSDNIIGEWYAFLCPGLSPYGPTTEPPVQPWVGHAPPVGLGPQWLGTPLPSPSGPVLDSLSQAQTGEAVPAPSTFGGCSWGYSAMGSAVSGPMDMAIWAIPQSIEIYGWWVYYVGVTTSAAFGGPRFYGAWGLVR